MSRTWEPRSKSESVGVLEDARVGTGRRQIHTIHNLAQHLMCHKAEI